MAKKKKKVAKKQSKKVTKKPSKVLSKRKAPSGKGCRKKGLDFERWVANSIGHIFPDAQRRLEYQASNVNGCDLDNTGSYGIQCKCRQTYASVSTIKEVRCPNDVIPILVTKANNAPPVVVMYFEDWVNMLEQIKTNVLDNDTLISGQELKINPPIMSDAEPMDKTIEVGKVYEQELKDDPVLVCPAEDFI